MAKKLSTMTSLCQGLLAAVLPGLLVSGLLMAVLTSCSWQPGDVEKRSTTWEIAAFYVFSVDEIRNDLNLLGVALKELYKRVLG